VFGENLRSNYENLPGGINFTMVTTRSQSVSPRKKRAPINYAELANVSPGSSTTTTPKTRALSPTKRTTSTSTRRTPRRKSMAVALDEIVVKSEDEGYVNGSAV